VIQLIKGEASHWVNKSGLLKERFEWQDEYFAVSVSESQVSAVRSYIANQENHHKKNTFEEEYQEFIKRYNLKEHED
jgi:REP element-mobilizing transposase RayT